MSKPVTLPTTAAECTKLAVIALDQAEKLVNRDGEKSAALAAVVARIGQGWAAAARAMLESERSVTMELTEFDPPQKWSGVEPLPESLAQPGDHQHTSFCRHNWIRPMEPCANDCGQRADGAVVPTEYCPAMCRVTDPPVPAKVPDHAHTPDCEHPWNKQTGRCDQCSQLNADCYPRCPVACPEPGANT